MEEKPIYQLSTIPTFLLGSGCGFILDMVNPLAADISIARTLEDALAFPILIQFTRYNSLQERVLQGAAVYVGSIYGQAAYHILSNL